MICLEDWIGDRYKDFEPVLRSAPSGIPIFGDASNFQGFTIESLPGLEQRRGVIGAGSEVSGFSSV